MGENGRSLRNRHVRARTITASGSPGEQKDPPTEARCGAPAGWKSYVNRVHGFCLSYPSFYAPDSEWFGNDYLSENNRYTGGYIRKATRENRIFALRDTRSEHSGVLVLFDELPFDLESFVTPPRYSPGFAPPFWHAPTGDENPPVPMRMGNNTFYYYGPGGGGVCYPDMYYFNLRGKVLRVIFHEPCQMSKTPPEATKEIEAQILGTLRVFR